MRLAKKNIDEELLKKIKQDNKNALDSLFDKYFQGLCDFSNKFLNNAFLAEEAVSDVFLNIWLKRGELEIKTSLKAYLFTAVKNQSLNYLKKENNIYDDIEVVDRNGTVSVLRTDDFFRYEELKEEINIILEKLPEKMRLVFKLSRIEGFTYKEIAEILSISVYTVQNHMVKATKYLSAEYPHLLFWLIGILNYF